MSGEWDSKVCQLCNQELSGRGVWKYCSDYCRNEVKRQTNQKDYIESQKQENEGYRKYRSEVIRFSRFRNYHGLTKPQLEPLVIRVASFQERPPLFNAPEFTFYIRMPHRGKDWWKSPLGKSLPAFLIKIVGMVKLVREHCLQQGELIVVALTLFVEAEIYRLKFLGNPNQRRFLEKSRTRLTSAKRICELSRRYNPGDYKAATTYLGYFLTPSFEETLISAGEQPEQFADSLRVLEQQINSIDDAVRPLFLFKRKTKGEEIQDSFVLIFNQVDLSEEDCQLLLDKFLGDDPPRPCPKGDFCGIAGWQYGVIRKEVMLLA